MKLGKVRATRCDAPHDLTVAKKVESLVEEACHSYDFQRTHSPQATGKTLDCFMEGTVSVKHWTAQSYTNFVWYKYMAEH